MSQLTIAAYLLIGIFFAVKAVTENKELWHRRNPFFVFLFNLLLWPPVALFRTLDFILDHLYLG